MSKTFKIIISLLILVMILGIASIDIKATEYAETNKIAEANKEIKTRWSNGEYQNCVDNDVNVSVGKAYILKYGDVLSKIHKEDLHYESVIYDPRLGLGSLFEIEGIITAENEYEPSENNNEFDKRYKDLIKNITIRINNKEYACAIVVPKNNVHTAKHISVGKIVKVTGFITGKGSFASGEKHLNFIGICEQN